MSELKKYSKQRTLSSELTGENNDMINEILLGIQSRFPIMSAFIRNIPLIPSDNIPTAGTDGKVVYYNKKYLESLPLSQRQFALAHEYLHIYFNHTKRSKGKNPMLWNVATDAVINAKLKEEGLEMIKGGVDMKEGKTMSADEIYKELEKQPQNLPKEKIKNHNMWNSKQAKDDNNNQQPTFPNEQDTDDSQQEQNKQNNTSSNQQSSQPKNDQGQSQDQNSQQKNEQQNNGQQNKPANGQQNKPGDDYSDKEKQFTYINSRLKSQMAQKIKQELLKKQKENSAGWGGGAGKLKEQYGDVGESDSVVSWKKLLRREIEKEEDRWTYRRASEENYFQAGISSFDTLDRPTTEVMIDTSGSVSEDLVREFLRQLKPLLKQSKLKVACFDSFVYDFVEIKTKDDINNFIIEGGGGTDFDNAVSHFTRDKKVNKIVFTDGFCDFTLNDKAYKNVIWIVYENRIFKPSMGKVINVELSQFKESQENNDELNY